MPKISVRKAASGPTPKPGCLPYLSNTDFLSGKSFFKRDRQWQQWLCYFTSLAVCTEATIVGLVPETPQFLMLSCGMKIL